MSILRLLALVAALVQAAPGAPTNLKILLNPSTPPGLPPGVTLREIDGGDTYYADNGFTVATQSLTFNGTTHTNGWDSPTFFPVGVWYTSYSNSVVPNTTTTWADVGLNTVFHYDNLDSTAATNNGISVMFASGGSALTGTYTNLHKLFMPADEPGTWGAASTPIALTTNARQDTRPWYINFTWNMAVHQNTWEGVYNGAPIQTPKGIMSRLITTPNGTQRHFDIGSFDIYWFTAAREPAWPYMTGTNGGGMIYHLPGTGSPISRDQMERGSNYGDVIDIMRGYQRAEEGGTPAPIIGYLEYGDPWEGGGALDAYFIRPHEMHWAYWSMLIHGVRAINMFDHVWNRHACNRCIVENTDNFYKTVQAGNTISLYQQLKNDVQLTHGLARIINAPFAIGYGSVSPSGYVFPTPSGGGWHDGGYAMLSLNTGIEMMAKYYSGGSFTNSYGTFTNGFYIFAGVRGSATQTNVPATFTIPNTGATTVTVINEGRTIPITNGGTQFADTFATAYTTHIYKIN
jgi:hypothetical protein